MGWCDKRPLNKVVLPPCSSYCNYSTNSFASSKEVVISEIYKISLLKEVAIESNMIFAAASKALYIVTISFLNTTHLCCRVLESICIHNCILGPKTSSFFTEYKIYLLLSMIFLSTLFIYNVKSLLPIVSPNDLVKKLFASLLAHTKFLLVH